MRAALLPVAVAVKTAVDHLPGSIEIDVRRPAADERPPLPIEVRYGETAVLAGGLATDRWVVSLPFAGGALDPGQFTARSELPATGLEITVTIRPPALSRFEARAERELPAQLERMAAPNACSDASPDALVGLRAALVRAGRAR